MVEATDQTFEKFLANLKYWLEEEHSLKAVIGEIEDKPTRKPKVDVELFTDEGEEFYIGNYADPGLHVIWLGPHDFGMGPRMVVTVNGILMEALGKHVAGWVVGYI